MCIYLHIYTSRGRRDLNVTRRDIFRKSRGHNSDLRNVIIIVGYNAFADERAARGRSVDPRTRSDKESVQDDARRRESICRYTGETQYNLLTRAARDNRTYPSPRTSRRARSSLPRLHHVSTTPTLLSSPMMVQVTLVVTTDTRWP